MPLFPKDESEILTFDLRCSRCGSVLRGPAPGESCPECGTDVAISLRKGADLKRAELAIVGEAAVAPTAAFFFVPASLVALRMSGDEAFQSFQRLVVVLVPIGFLLLALLLALRYRTVRMFADAPWRTPAIGALVLTAIAWGALGVNWFRPFVNHLPLAVLSGLVTAGCVWITQRHLREVTVRLTQRWIFNQFVRRSRWIGLCALLLALQPLAVARYEVLTLIAWQIGVYSLLIFMIIREIVAIGDLAKDGASAATMGYRVALEGPPATDEASGREGGATVENVSRMG